MSVGLRCHKHNKRKAGDDPQVWQGKWIQGRCCHSNLRSQGLLSQMWRLLTAFLLFGQIFFIESVCDDPGVIASNIMVSHGRKAVNKVFVTLGIRCVTSCLPSLHRKLRCHVPTTVTATRLMQCWISRGGLNATKPATSLWTLISMTGKSSLDVVNTH